ADNLTAADLLADGFDGLFAISTHRPTGLHADNAMNEVLKELCAVRRVHDFRMKLHAVIFALLIRNNGKWCIWRSTHNGETIRQRCYAVAVAHPDLMTGALGPDAFKERTVFLH